MSKAPSPPYAGPANRHGGPGNKPIRRVVMHCTVSSCADSADAIARYFRVTDRAASAHYVVDADKTLQVVWDSLVAYHAPPNEYSIGVELCCTLANEGKGHWGRADHKRMLERAAELVAALCLAYDVPMTWRSGRGLRAGKDGVCGHADVRDAWGQTVHWDPGPHFPKRRFMRMVRAAAKSGAAPSQPAAKSGPTAAEKREKRRKQREAAQERRRARRQNLRDRAAGKTNEGRVDRARARIRIAANRAANKVRRSRLYEWLRTGPKR